MAEETGSSPPRRSEGPPRLLIVDDERHVRTILARWLSAEGYDCESAVSAEEALERLENGTFSLLITDIGLPGMSGIDLLKIVKSRFADTAVIMVTASDDRTTAIRALGLGAYGYVIKPFERNEVAINVVNALERQNLVSMREIYERDLEAMVCEQTEEIRSSREEIILRLIAAQEYRHDETGAHIRRISLGAEGIARELGFPKDESEMLRLAAPMHDVGKIAIPDTILTKPSALTKKEWEIMRTHTTIGGHILGGTSIPLLEMSRNIALCHHEKWDGSGYPQGISGTDIPQVARIVTVVDVYDALVHDRVYRPAFTKDEALAMVCRERETHFDPRILDIFLKMVP
jgi:putative two-component system response regulator